jgi:uncharacterized surface protein with fasciclin (FAS1) repeats
LRLARFSLLIIIPESRMKNIHRLLLTTAAALLAAGCATAPAPKNIVETAAATPQLSTLTKLIQEAGLTETLAGPGPFTVFAPTDDAFRAVPASTLQALSQDKARLKAVLTYHAVAGAVMAADVKNGPVKSVQGANLALARSGSFVTVEDAVVTTADVKATNGVVHIVDKVLMPPARAN